MSTPTYQSAKGAHDILPDDHLYFSFFKKVARHHCRRAGFRRISTPIFENAELFENAVGKGTDIVEKKIYTLKNESGAQLALRPEGTAPVVRAYLEHDMQALPNPVELYYIEAFFQQDNTRPGGYHQFHQFSVEVIGEDDPAIDAQVINLIHRINQDLGIADQLTLQLNTIGSMEDRMKFKEDLVNYYTGKERSMCENCKRCLNENPMRLLNCKEEDCQILASMAPKLETILSDESKEHFQLVRDYLDELGVKYELNPLLVRGLDYYTHTVFEFWSEQEGVQHVVGGGGRYNELVERMGGEPTPAIGFSTEIESAIAHMKEAGIKPPNKDKVDIFFAQLGLVAKKKSLPLIQALRDQGINTVGAVGKSSMKGQIGLASELNARYSLILGQVEVRDGTIILRDMKRGSQETIPVEGIIEKMLELLGGKKLSDKKLWEE